jgi:3-phosphoshikimate 1-carboxyvinyltransferase
MLAALGVVLTRDNGTIALQGPQELTARDWRIPADPSAATFFVVAALLVPGSDLLLSNVSLNPTRTAAFDVLRAMGGDIAIDETGEDGGEPFGNVRARASELKGVSVDPSVVPALIDEIPILAIAATQAEGQTSFAGAAELRVKESDRIDALTTALRILNVQVEALPDGLLIEGPATLGEGDVDARGDHRIAMSLAVAALIARTDIRIRGWSSVETSFPGFIETLGKARGLRR